jgi:hypothetical protein
VAVEFDRGGNTVQPKGVFTIRDAGLSKQHQRVEE